MPAPSLSPLALRIDAVLPQTQCTQCGFPDCQSYASALADGETELNRCPPGGIEGIHTLAQITGRPALPLDPSCGFTQPFALALIEEEHCIGCTLCIQACPVDAIIGAPKLMHSVLASECTGCELCIAPCPVDCIVMVAAERPSDPLERDQQTMHWRERHQFNLFRLEREQQDRTLRLAAKALQKQDDPHFAAPDKQAKIAQALARAQDKISSPAPELTPQQAKIAEMMARAAKRLGN